MGGRTTVDLGLGDQPDTTVELFNELGPRVIGVDADPSRVARAQSFARPGLEFASTFENADLIRAMNVLRGYTVEAAAAETARWCALLNDGGLLVEGSTDVDGALGSAHLWRKRGEAVVHEGLYLFTGFSRGFAPMMFRDVLPRDLRRAVKPGQPVYEFLQRWQRAFDVGRVAGESPEASFERSVAALSDVRRDGPNALTWIAPAV
ncbi:MAG: methylase [Myxococcaceae bacterium]